jgi:hypothetical protein
VDGEMIQLSLDKSGRYGTDGYEIRDVTDAEIID